jgi:hypothetical protein
MLGLNHEGLKFIVIGKFSKKNSRIILYENAIRHVLSIQNFALQNYSKILFLYISCFINVVSQYIVLK